MIKVPFNRPFFGGNEILAVEKIIKSGQVSGNGVLSQKVESYMRDKFKIEFPLLTTSCTHALEMALMAVGIKEGDEVILPSFNFVSAANAIVRLNAKPIFVDIEDDYLNIDPLRIKENITKRTKAIICVHYAGLSCQMNEIMEIARKNELFVIEDAAHAIGSKYGNKFLGTIGDIGCLSFHGTKNISCGEGGAFLTNNEMIAKKAEIISEKGTNRMAFTRGEVDKYTWVDIGSSYVLSEILVAVLFEQFKKIDYIIEKRKNIGLKYFKGLKDLEKKGEIILPKFSGQDVNWHIFYFMVKDQSRRNSILSELRRSGIEATFHYVPLHLSPYAMNRYGYKAGILPVTERVSSSLIRLPIYPSLKSSDQSYVIDTLKKII